MANIEELIVYSNSRNGLGIRILGAKRATNKSGIYIKQILEDGLAQRDGRLKVGDQILSINDETSIGINREHAVNILRSAAATNQVRLRIKHFVPALSSTEYQKLLHDEKSTDDDDDNHRHHNITQNRNNNITTTNEVRMRKSSRRHHHNNNQQRHSAYNLTYDNSNNEQQSENNQLSRGLDVSHDALQALLNSRFKLIDLVDLVKKTYPNFFLNDKKRELQFVEQLSESTTDGRITLKEFERQSSVLLGERINVLVPFYSSSNNSSHSNDTELIVELRREIASCHATIDELQTKIVICEKSQRLSNEVEVEYEDLVKFLYEQLRQYKINETNQLKQIRANDQLIQKLFNYLSIYVNEPKDEHVLAQLKYEYEQQQKNLQNSNDISIISTNKYRQQF
ncbi:unnamed protein product [Rotaria socialis]|uniref:PDZ domain-containing protein n=1 Tax=Rotaria socialis TaxID=392032 RepID=A0A817KKX6_9BILA|nr:unnamed protein product [Rotaria socialis]CAF3266337.1 unnamed protein product [Rotaria socialis]CAF3398864.1 unnamed protein product [Rotaria socialis]CAF3778795.1 unnamed protein product [Rotaria socialis]CAF3782538.1 unnamed protein product [Rotaria socialis]